MKRRTFNQSLMALAGLTAGAGALRAAAAITPTWAEQFHQAMQDNPWLLGYRSVAQDAVAARAEVSGKWPAELRGTLYRNGPAQHEVAGYRYRHLFDGDGMVQGYFMGPEGVSHKGKLVQTYKLAAERKAGRPLYSSFASDLPDPAPVTSADAVNVANISVLHHHGKLLALWEAGSPWEMDAQTLDTKGVYAFSEHTQGVPFSAHPRVEPDGTLWNFGYVSQANLLVLWHINPQGQVVKMGKVQAEAMSMVHDFVVTERHLVLMIPPLHYEPDDNTGSFLAAHKWHAEKPTKVLVVDKNDFDNHYWLDLPAQWVFHYGNAWEDNAGIIRFDAPRSPDPVSVIDSFSELMRGNITPGTPVHHHQYQIDTRARRVSEAPMFGMHLESEFPAIDPRVSGKRYRRVVMLSRNHLLDQPAHVNLNEVSTMDLDTGQRRSYRYPDEQIPEEHLFVPRPGSAPESAGWVVGSALDWQRGQMLLNVFNVEAVDDGPVATARLPYALPLGLHGKFVHA